MTLTLTEHVAVDVAVDPASRSTSVKAAIGTSVKCKAKDGVDVHGHVKVKDGVNDKVDDNVQRQPVSFIVSRY